MLGAPRRTADVLLVLTLVVAVTSVGLLALDHDPDLGYTSDPELTRALWWVVLPGAAALLLALAGPVVGLVRGLVDRPTQALSLASAADSPSGMATRAEAEGRSAWPTSTDCGRED